MARASGSGALLLTLVVASCGGGALTGGAGNGGAGGRGGSSGGVGGLGVNKDGWVILMDANNYTSASSLTIPTVQTAPGVDLRICWTDLHKDQFCHRLETSSDIHNVAFLQIPKMSHDQVAAAFAIGQLDQATIRKYADYHTPQSPESTCANLSQFRLGTALVPATDYVQDSNTTYLLLFTTGTTPGVGSRSMLFLEPTSASTVTAVDAVDACAADVLNFQATFGQPLPIARTDSTRWHLDWSQLTRDSFGNAIAFPTIDSVQIAFFQNLTVADVQAQFIDIDLIASMLYGVVVPAGAQDVDLADARSTDGLPLPGFTRTDGVWGVALTCSRCQTPLPVVFSVLQPQ